ncbi:MAG: hypothetical protein MUF51_01850, partial [Vicinamibacteria bacterium]|nr:hypothetical protein [Vicinamibacteria bacterium]
MNHGLRGIVCGVILALAAFCATPLAAQGLGEAAKKEKARREKQKSGPPAPQYTDDTLTQQAKPSPSPKTGEGKTITISVPRDSENSSETAHEGHWRAQAKEKRVKLTAAEAALKALVDADRDLGFRILQSSHTDEILALKTKRVEGQRAI